LSKNWLIDGIKWFVGLPSSEELQDLWENMKGMFANAAQWMYTGIIHTFPALSMWILDWSLAAIGKMREEIVKWILLYIKETTGVELPPRDYTGYDLHKLSEEFQKHFATSLLDSMLNLIMPDEPLTPEKGKESAERFLRVNLAFQVDAWLLHVIADIASLGKLKALKDLPNAISWSYGIGWLSWLVMGTPFRIGIADPLEKLYNWKYTPASYTMAQLCRLKTAHLISDKEFLDTARYLGYDQTKAYNLWIDSLAEFSDTDLRDLYYEGLITKDDIVYYLNRRGYHDTRAKAIATLITTDRTRELRQDLANELLRAYREDRVTESQVRSILQLEGWNDTDIDLALNKERFIRGHRRELTVSQTKELLDWGLITREEYHRRLQRMGYDPVDIELLETLEKKKREREEIMARYWSRYSELQQALSKAGVENWWYALGELSGHEEEIGRMSDSEWKSYMKSFVEAHGGKL